MKRNAGFTLLELMISIGIFTIVMLGSVKMVIDQRKSYQTADQYLELQGKVRAALDILAGEVRMAGSGVNNAFATPIIYAFNDNSTLGPYPTPSNLKNAPSEISTSRSFGIIGFQYDRRVETRNDGTVLRDIITNSDVMLIAMSSASSSDATFKSVTMETYTDEGTSQCSLVSSTADCSSAYVSSGSTAINLKGATTTELFKLNMYTITSSGANYSTNEIMDNVISFDVTYYLDSSDTGYTDTQRVINGSLGDDFDNDADGSFDEKSEVAVISSTTSTTCDSGGSTAVFCSASTGILKVPLATKNASSVDVTGNTTLSPSTNIHEIYATASTTLTAAPTIAAGSSGDYVTIVNTGLYPITFQDKDVASTATNLELKRTTTILSPGQSVTLTYTSSKWVETSPAVANIAAVKMTLTARSAKKDPKSGKYLVYSGSVTTKLRGYAL